MTRSLLGTSYALRAARFSICGVTRKSATATPNIANLSVWSSITRNAIATIIAAVIAGIPQRTTGLRNTFADCDIPDHQYAIIYWYWRVSELESYPVEWLYFSANRYSTGMISHENEVMILLGVATVILLVSMSSFTDLPTWITIAVVIVVGVLIPQLISRKEEWSDAALTSSHG